MSTSAHTRERRQWTAQEDELLRQAVEREEPQNPAPSKWHAIAQHVPNRTNKDCRKRWYAKMSTDVVKGGWAPDEDQRLLNAIDCFGTRWSLVASMVQTRNSDQCAKRWCDTLNPAIDRTAWSLEADELLVQAVREHGTVWTKIVQMYFPGRTGLAAKNRYNSITRAEGSSRGSSRRRRSSPDSSPSPSLPSTERDLSNSPPDGFYYGNGSGSDSRYQSNHTTGNEYRHHSMQQMQMQSGPGLFAPGHTAFGGSSSQFSGGMGMDYGSAFHGGSGHGFFDTGSELHLPPPNPSPMRYSTPAPVPPPSGGGYPDYAALLSMPPPPLAHQQQFGLFHAHGSRKY